MIYLTTLCSVDFQHLIATEQTRLDLEIDVMFGTIVCSGRFFKTLS